MINTRISDDPGSLPRVSLGLTPGGQPRLGSGVVVATRDGVMQSVNNAICRIFGYKRDELIGSPVKILMPKVIADQHDEILRRYFAGGSFKTTKTRVVFGVTKPGLQIKLQLCLSYIENPGSTPMICAMVDEVEEHSFSLVASSDGTIVSVDGHCEETCGYKNLVGANVSILCPAYMDHTKFMRGYSSSNPSNVIGHLRRREMRHAAGHMIPISLMIQKRSDDPLLLGATITEIESSFEAVLTANAAGTILFVDAMCALVFGYQQDEMVGLPLSTISPRMAMKEGKTIASCVHRDGSQFFVAVDVQSFVQGGELCYRGIIRRTQANRSSRQRSTIKREDSFTALDSIDWYEVSDKVLGTGLCGGVKLATHRLTGIQVALKILRKKQYEEMQMLYPPREVALLKGLCHPHIVRLLQVIVNPDATFLVMQKLQGGELLDYLAQQEHLSEGESRSIMRQIVMGVDYMHRCGIVHRDLKLENIIVDAQRQIKIIDLGLGNYFDSKTPLSTFCGSADYAPPEIWLSQPYAGPEVDMWSLGVILYALATGFMPFNGSAQILELRYHWPQGITISEPLQDLVARLLTRTKHRASMEEVLEHPWLVNGYKLDRLPNAPPKLDETILMQMESLGFPKESVKQAVVTGECNQLGAVYALFELQMEDQARSRRSSLAGSSSGLPSLAGSRRGSIDGSPRSRPSSPKGKHDATKTGGSSGNGSPRDDLRDSQKRCIIA